VQFVDLAVQGSDGTVSQRARSGSSVKPMSLAQASKSVAAMMISSQAALA
jgi:hypothetical protein